MKTLLSIALVICFNVCFGQQQKFFDSIYSGKTIMVDTNKLWIRSDPIKHDTIPTIMLVIDTTIIHGILDCGNCPNHFYNYMAYWQKGYMYNTDRYKVYWEYLDEDKKPFPKNIIVWLSK